MIHPNDPVRKFSVQVSGMSENYFFQGIETGV